MRHVRVCGGQPSPQNTNKPSLKEFNKSKKKEGMKTPQRASNRLMKDKEKL